MPYSFYEIPHSESETHYYTSPSSCTHPEMDINGPVDQWEVLDPEGDRLAIVFSEGEAEALVSHLNR